MAMSDVLVMDGFGGFEAALRSVLRERGAVEVPAGLEQRLLARLAQEEDAVVLPVMRPFAFAERVAVRRSSAGTWWAVGAHAAVLLVVLAVASMRVMMQGAAVAPVASVELSVPPAVVKPSLVANGGGGGQHDAGKVAEGHLPRLEQQQMVTPKAPPMIAPKLVVEPSVVVQPDLKMADNAMPNIGMPNSTVKGFSLGRGNGGGLGDGSGNGMGPGTGGNVGDGAMRVGGSVSAPKLVLQVDPEFSEEARRSKFSGNVYVLAVVDERGNVSSARVERGVGMGLDEKAVEAVKQYKFKPGMQNGKPVKTEVEINVDFKIF
jgi:periplasmic protein TonB